MTDLEASRDVAPHRSFWLRPSSYWQPAHFTVSAWQTHAPFAAWLIDVLRPSEIVELGTHYGFSCFTFAEAAARLGLTARINAVDSWQGDEHAGFYGDEVYESVQRVVTRDYPKSVRLLRGWFSDARPLFEDRTVALLHIDGRHGYEDVTADFAQWRDTVRDGGIVLFHDIAEHERGFGVWRLWEELATTERTFAFEHGHGLGVVAIGEPPVGPLHDLFAADEVTADLIRADFARLGAVVAESSRLHSLPAELEQVRAQVLARDREVAELMEAVADRDRRIDENAVRIQDCDRRLAAVNGRLADVEASTSWRVTAPMRSVSRVVRGRLRQH